MRAVMLVQAACRRFMNRRVYRKAWKCVVQMQARNRGHAVRTLFSRIMSYTRVMKEGAIFLKFARSSPPHDRFVWLSNDLHTVCWCHPDRPTKFHSMSLKDCTEIADGATTKTFLRSAHKKGNSSENDSADNIMRTSSLRLKLIPSLKKDFDQILHPSDSFSCVHNANLAIGEQCCLSVVSKKRTLDLVATSGRVRDDWLWGLRMLLHHWTGTSDLANVHSQRKMLGVDEEFCEQNRFKAVDILGDEYVEYEFEVQRVDAGMGIALDAASNVIVEVTPGSAGEIGGLLQGDLVTVVDGTAVTVIDDGYAMPRCAVPAAIDPSSKFIHITVFRTFTESARDESARNDDE